MYLMPMQTGQRFSLISGTYKRRKLGSLLHHHLQAVYDTGFQRKP